MARFLVLALLPLVPTVAGPLCPLTHCGSEMAACALDGMCRGSIGCVLSCGPMIAKGTMAFGGCVQACAMEKPSEAFNAIGKCVFDNRCAGVPFPMAGRCKKPNNTMPIDLNMFEGFWWNIYGHDKTGDCQRCHFRTWHQVPNSGKLEYGDNTLVVDHNNQYFNFTYIVTLDSQVGPKNSWIFNWGMEHGLDFKEEWWLLDDTPEYKQIYYCATDMKINPGQQIEGGVVLSKSKEISGNVLPRIAEVFKPYYDFNRFCKNDNTCPTGAPRAQILV